MSVLSEMLFGAALQRALGPCHHGRLRAIRECEFCDYDERCCVCGEPAKQVERVTLLSDGEIECLQDKDGRWYCGRKTREDLQGDGYHWRFRFYTWVPLASNNRAPILVNL